MCGADLARIRDDMVITLAGDHAQLNILNDAEAVVAFAISVSGGKRLPGLPVLIRNRPSASLLTDIIMAEMDKRAGDADRLAFLFSTVSAIHLTAPQWFNTQEYLNAIWNHLTEIWPDMQPTPWGSESGRDWEADTDIVLLRRIGAAEAGERPKADVQQAVMRKILTAINVPDLIAPNANTLRTLNAMKRLNIRWNKEFGVIEKNMRGELQKNPSLAVLEFMDV